MNREIRELEDAIFNLKRRVSEQKECKFKKQEIMNICENYLASSKLNSEFRKMKFIEDNGFSSIDDLNEWIKRCERDFVEMIEKLKGDMV